jgi:hypothetical protein
VKLSEYISDRNNLLIFGVVIVLTRIPFLFDGFGSEEDAWGLIVTARNIYSTGLYEVSRLPGHPIHELFLALIHKLPPWFINLLTAFTSTLGVVFFVKILKHYNIENALWAGIALAFTPVFFINSTNVMDYTWASTLIILSTYYTIKKQPTLSGILLGIAVGFRITSGAMLLPLVLLNYSSSNRSFSKNRNLKLVVSTILISFLSFLPPLLTYGISFFTFYEYFPYPPLLKNIYKATIGVWGLPGTLGIVTCLVLLIFSVGNKMGTSQIKKDKLIWFSIISITLYVIAFFRIPQKSAFIIPILPWLYLLFWKFLPA